MILQTHSHEEYNYISTLKEIKIATVRTTQVAVLLRTRRKAFPQFLMESNMVKARTNVYSLRVRVG